MYPSDLGSAGHATGSTRAADANGRTPADARALRIGVLALQGAFAEHGKMVRQLAAEAPQSIEAIEVRRPEQLAALDGLIIPGGESTSMGLVAQRWGLVEPLRAWVRRGMPTFGTCAGMILLAERAANQKLGGQPLIGGLDVTVNRNYFGRQVDSFETDLAVLNPGAGQGAADQSDTGHNDAGHQETGRCHAVFIRAPAITEVGASVQILAQLDQEPPVYVAVRDGVILATAFHPELTADLRWHRLFLQMVAEHRNQVAHTA